MGLYRLLVCDLLTDQLRDVLSVQDLRFDDYIGKAGSLSGKVPVPNCGIASRVQAALIPGRTALWVERGADVWWGGVLWTMTPQTDERGKVSVDLQAATFDSYLEHRLLYDSVTISGDQLECARQLVDYAQTKPGGDIGIHRAPLMSQSGTERRRTFDGHDATTVREALDKIARQGRGFEWRIRAHQSRDGERHKTLELGAPVIRTDAPPVMCTFPGNVLSYAWPQDATETATVWRARGATTNTNQTASSRPLLSDLLTDRKALRAGWPRLDGTSDHNTVRQKDTLDDLARAELDAARRPVTIPTLKVRPGDDVTPGLIGRSVRLRVRDVWHHQGLDDRFRVVGIAVEAAERGRAESAELYLEEEWPTSRETSQTGSSELSPGFAS